MLYKSYANNGKRFKWNPFEIFRQNYTGDIPANFSLVSRGIHIQFSLNCRLLIAAKIFCLRIADIAIISQLKHSKHKKSQSVFKQRVIESNQYDNLSPPHLAILVCELIPLNKYVCKIIKQTS
jgi:hypothetical protein